MTYMVHPTGESIERWNTELADLIESGDLDPISEDTVLEAHISDADLADVRDAVAAYNEATEEEDDEGMPLQFRLLLGTPILPVEVVPEVAA